MANLYKATSQALAICVTANVPVILWGDPGQGKTSVVQNICESYGLHLETIIASTREPSDFSGYPYPEAGVARLAAASWANTIVEMRKENKISVAFFDEISTAPPAVQAALLRPILERVVGELNLPTETRMIAAANPPDIAADGWELSLPSANRFTHLDWNLPAAVVREGFTKGWATISFPHPQKASVYARNKKEAMTIVGEFLGRNPKLVTAIPTNFSGAATPGKDFKANTYAFPTPRSWEYAAILYASHKHATFPDGSKPSKTVLRLLLEGTVGTQATHTFLNYLTELDLPDPKRLLEHPETYEMPKRGDILSILLEAIQSEAKHNLTSQNWLSWGNLLASTVEQGKGDIAYPHVLEWHRNRPQHVIPTPEQAKRLNKILTMINPQ